MSEELDMFSWAGTCVSIAGHFRRMNKASRPRSRRTHLPSLSSVWSGGST